MINKKILKGPTARFCCGNSACLALADDFYSPHNHDQAELQNYEILRILGAFLRQLLSVCLQKEETKLQMGQLI